MTRIDASSTRGTLRVALTMATSLGTNFTLAITSTQASTTSNTLSAASKKKRICFIRRKQTAFLECPVSARVVAMKTYLNRSSRWCMNTRSSTKELSVFASVKMVAISRLEDMMPPAISRTMWCGNQCLTKMITWSIYMACRWMTALLRELKTTGLGSLTQEPHTLSSRTRCTKWSALILKTGFAHTQPRTASVLLSLSNAIRFVSSIKKASIHSRNTWRATQCWSSEWKTYKVNILSFSGTQASTCTECQAVSIVLLLIASQEVRSCLGEPSCANIISYLT